MKRVLFLCTGNSCRSQMAEAFARHHWGERYECHSAGTKKHGMNPWAQRVMAEIGLPLAGHFSKTVDELPPVAFDYVVTVCSDAHENCPYFAGGKVVHIGFDDPPRLTANLSDEESILQVYRRVRDEIKATLLELPRHLCD